MSHERWGYQRLEVFRALLVARIRERFADHPGIVHGPLIAVAKPHTIVMPAQTGNTITDGVPRTARGIEVDWFRGAIGTLDRRRSPQRAISQAFLFSNCRARVTVTSAKRQL